MDQPQRATIVVTWHNGFREEIPVQYNPTELTLSKGAQLAEITIPGLDSPVLQFVRGQSETLTLDLFFDSTESGMGAGAMSVTSYTDRIYQLVKIEPDAHAPPVCEFHWKRFPGNDVSASIGASQKRECFRGVIESIKQRFTLFSPLGVPLRAVLTVTLREYKTLDEQMAQLNLMSPDRSQSHVVQRGETLSGIAARHYNRSTDWRYIADENGIDDPRRLTVGAILRIPPIQ
jgi:hypothetical protein